MSAACFTCSSTENPLTPMKDVYWEIIKALLSPQINIGYFSLSDTEIYVCGKCGWLLHGVSVFRDEAVKSIRRQLEIWNQHVGSSCDNGTEIDEMELKTDMLVVEESCEESLDPLVDTNSEDVTNMKVEGDSDSADVELDEPTETLENQESRCDLEQLELADGSVNENGAQDGDVNQNRSKIKRKRNKDNSTHKKKINMESGRKSYTPETLKHALDEINKGLINVYKASKTYKIPHTTLYEKSYEKHKQDRPGAPTVLTKHEEQMIVDWITKISRTGFIVTKYLLLHSVQKLVLNLDRTTTFKDGLPGRHWYEAFLMRHPEIRKKVRPRLTKSRVEATEGIIRAWFQRARQYFEDNRLSEVLEDPSRIFNCNECAFFLEGKVLKKTGTKPVYSETGDEKECLTLLLGASANGKLMPVLALPPYKRIPANISEKYPKDWAVSKSDTGWMTCENIYEYVTNVFHPFLIKDSIKKPVLMFLDGHVPHLSLHLYEYCNENGIILVALLPSSTKAWQPMDVAVHSLKNAWSEAVSAWREDKKGRLKREDFGPVLGKTIKDTLKPGVIVNGFRQCGLYPFNENAVDYDRLKPISETSSSSI